uniref:Uncharacterized protein n=1 Tax=Rhizophora mucronata TaxID=61149 RepID=A0A2P2MXN8_RHIMU
MRSRTWFNFRCQYTTFVWQLYFPIYRC